MDPHRINQSPPPSPSSDTSFPILIISILGILATGILLLSYHIFVVKCCLNWRRSDIIGRLFRRRYRRREDLVAVFSVAREVRGLQESAIRAIPTLRYRAVDRNSEEGKESSFNECAVCLNEFQEEERIRMLPNCFHVFHIDCIDTWLQTNGNCPICRSDITTNAPMSAPQFMAQTIHEDLRHGENIVIELGEEDRRGDRTARIEGSRRNHSPAKIGERRIGYKNGRKLQHVCSMGDECIDVRMKDEQFSVQPMRRSFSMDSSNDKQLCLAVQEIMQQNPRFKEEGSSSGGGGSTRGRRLFFSFGHSRSSVLPVQIEP